MRAIFAGRNRKIIPVLLGFLVLNVCALGQDIPTGKPESIGLSSERLERIGTVVQRNIDDKRIAGAITMVIRHGHVMFAALMRRCSDMASRLPRLHVTEDRQSPDKIPTGHVARKPQTVRTSSRT